MYMTNSSPNTPIKTHLKFLHQTSFAVSFGAGMFRCIADQTQRLRASKQDIARDTVPRPLGLATQPAVFASEQSVCAISTNPLEKSERQVKLDMPLLLQERALHNSVTVS
jgi:hypothetical protein